MVNFIEKLVFALGWIKIVMSPLAIGVITGLLTANSVGGTKGFIIGGIIALLGLVIGVIWAERVRRKHGSMNFLGRNYQAAETDEMKNSENKKK